ncbi:MAG TPA: AraC family transcriptional regulator [Planctomycetota bacterium]|nr:AraC family transcriptional regulator [Planctomycetota bacterium]
MREPARLLTAEIVPVQKGVAIPAHSHDDILQMDLAVGCAGYWTNDGKKVQPSLATAMAFYPGASHGYAIKAGSENAEICNFKLRIQRSWPAVKQRIFPPVLQNVSVHAPLHTALRRMARLNASKQQRSPLLMAALVEVLCLWPREGETSGAPRASGEVDPRLQPAVMLVDENLNDPPGIKELSSAAHLSPRHFVRAFQAQFGCTPHEYATQRRLERARQILLQGRTTITQAAEQLGFPSIHTFSRWFRRETGLSPQQFRQKPDRF